MNKSLYLIAITENYSFTSYSLLVFPSHFTEIEDVCMLLSSFVICVILIIHVHSIEKHLILFRWGGDYLM